MLLSFSVSNYKSFNQEVCLSLETILPKSRLPENYFSEGRYVSHKSVVIYGANASGKSNLLKALNFAKNLILKSAHETQVGEKINTIPFKLTQAMDNSSQFEFIFVLNGEKYRYGFRTTQEAITAEWLFRAHKVKEHPLFIRENQNIDVRDKFIEGKNLEKRTRENTLFLSLVAQFNGEISKILLSWFRNINIISGLNDLSGLFYTVDQLKDSKLKKKAIDWLKSADLGIDGIEIEYKSFSIEDKPQGIPDELWKFIMSKGFENKAFSVKLMHNILDENNKIVNQVGLDLDTEESEGTKKFFSLFGPIFDTLSNGKVLVIDELDSRMHPLLTREIINWFNSDEFNKKGAQLIFATHDTNLLSKKSMRRDQIWFTEKDRSQSTDLYTLAEYILPSGSKKVRQDESWEKGYFQGRYGAIPFISDFSELIKA